VPIITLPKNQELCGDLLTKMYSLNKQGKDFGGESPFKYAVNEIVDNIYQHSSFENAYLMAQKYIRKGFVEICFFDDGISIPGNYLKYGFKLKDHEALVEAINGLSTKGKERGFGLSSTIKLFTKGLGGEVLLLSGAGAVYMSSTTNLIYKVDQVHVLKGTLVSIRCPFPTKEVDIYEHIQ